MRSRRSPTPASLALPVATALPLLGACDGVQSTLAPDGPRAAAIAELWWVMLAISTVVFLIVCALLVYALFRRREFPGERPPLPLAPQAQKETVRRRYGKPEKVRDQEAEEGQESGGELELTESDDEPLDVWMETLETDRRSIRGIILAGVAIPAVILIGTLLYTLVILGRLADRQPADLTIEVIGWQWWWEVHYFDPEGRQLFETANEIHIPVGKRVAVRLKSADVIHSFWVPQLAGKLDMIPGRTNQFWIQADEPGVYRGQCAEYCEGPHALMAFLVIAQPEAEFAAWVEHQRQDEIVMSDPLAILGREVFLNTACKACHAVRGTPAVGNIGPDLTHVASRRTLAAASFPNTKGHMGGWLTSPQHLKPKVHMPAVPLTSDEFLALLRYMESLR